MKKVLQLILSLLITNLIMAQNVQIKDSADQLLLQVNDEGTDNSSITIPNSGTAPTSTTSKLYNEGGILKWGGSTLATGSSLWTLNNGNVYRTTGNVGIGTQHVYSRLTVGGSGSTNANIFSERSTGNAIHGIATNSGSYTNRGGYFEAYGTTARAVQGYAGSSSSINYGGYFTSDGINGVGVYGLGKGKGVQGVSILSGGYGLHGHATHPSGNSYGVYGETTSPNGWAGYFEGRGYFSENVGVNTTSPSAKLDVSGDVVLGENGTRFLEIQEITGTTGTSNGVTIPNALPTGWTGTTTRVLSFEIQYGSATGDWVTSGNDFINTQPSISASLGYNSRTITLFYPDMAVYHNQSWRMVIMKMP